MARVVFTSHLKRYVSTPPTKVEGKTIRQVLEAVFCQNPQVRGYIVDDQDRLREHIVIFVEGSEIQDRQGLSDPVQEESEVFIMQALSGGGRLGRESEQP